MRSERAAMLRKRSGKDLDVAGRFELDPAARAAGPARRRTALGGRLARRSVTRIGAASDFLGIRDLVAVGVDRASVELAEDDLELVRSVGIRKPEKVKRADELLLRRTFSTCVRGVAERAVGSSTKREIVPDELRVLEMRDRRAREQKNGEDEGRLQDGRS